MRTHARRVLYGGLFGMGIGLLALALEYAPGLVYVSVACAALYAVGWAIDVYRSAYRSAKGQIGLEPKDEGGRAEASPV